MEREKFPHQRPVADVAVYERVPGITLQRRKIGGITGVGQLVQIDNRLTARGKGVENEIRADKPGATGNEQHKRYSTCSAAMTSSGVSASMQRGRGHSASVRLHRLTQGTSRLNRLR